MRKLHMITSWNHLLPSLHRDIMCCRPQKTRSAASVGHQMMPSLNALAVCQQRTSALINHWKYMTWLCFTALKYEWLVMMYDIVKLSHCYLPRIGDILYRIAHSPTRPLFIVQDMYSQERDSFTHVSNMGFIIVYGINDGFIWTYDCIIYHTLVDGALSMILLFNQPFFRCQVFIGSPWGGATCSSISDSHPLHGTLSHQTYVHCSEPVLTEEGLIYTRE